ncbi:MAG: hypothetical protein FK733_00700, partial [Asgard group archaeon]|nr:hypothetical protein [Asgard group archaeon]
MIDMKSNNQQNSTKIKGKLLLEDIKQLADIIESSHPDPYSKGGGKIAFHYRLHKLLLSIPQEGLIKDDFQKLLLPFIAAIGDGHTRIHVKYNLNEKQPGGIPLYFDIIEKSLYVSGVIAENNKDLIGSVLHSVENIPFDVLCDRVSKIQGIDNEYGPLVNLDHKNYLWNKPTLLALIPEWNRDKITIELKSPLGEINEITFDTDLEYNQPSIMKESIIEIPSTEKSEFAYNFLDKNQKIALLRVDGMIGYRENFELVGIDNEFQLNDAKNYYQRFNEKQPPNDKSELINGIPSATETFRSLVIEMKQSKTETLIIDLRKNGGGNSLLANILVYFLFGKNKMLEYLTKKSGFEIIKYSDRYLEQVQNGKKETPNLMIELG